jgi:hypothetical protein
MTSRRTLGLATTLIALFASGCADEKPATPTSSGATTSGATTGSGGAGHGGSSGTTTSTGSGGASTSTGSAGAGGTPTTDTGCVPACKEPADPDCGTVACVDPTLKTPPGV